MTRFALRQTVSESKLFLDGGLGGECALKKLFSLLCLPGFADAEPQRVQYAFYIRVVGRQDFPTDAQRLSKEPLGFFDPPRSLSKYAERVQSACRVKVICALFFLPERERLLIKLPALFG